MRILKANELFFLSPHLARSTDKEGLLVAYYTGDHETDLVRRICGLRTLSVWHCQSFVKFILRIVLWTFWKSFPILFSRHTFGLEARGRLNISIDPCTSPGLAESLQSFLEKSGKRKLFPDEPEGAFLFSDFSRNDASWGGRGDCLTSR